LRTLENLALTIGAAVLFAGCGGSEQIGAPREMPQSGAMAEGVRNRTATLAPKAGIVSYAPDTQLVAVNGKLYGTTANGGIYSGGTVFSITTSGAEKVLHSFGYGSDGAGPSSMISVDGMLYGTTSGGGAYGKGVVFSLTTIGEERVLYSFGNSPDANSPTGLTNIHGTLYGTAAGGTYNFGTVFSITMNGVEKVLHNFGQGCGASCQGGSYPQGGLLDFGRRLYGATYGGGADNAGIVFSMSRKTGQTNVLYSFGSGSGSVEASGSLIDVDGRAYGTTGFGGKYGEGTIYRVSTNGTAKVLHNFDAGCKRRVDGQLPRAPLIDVNGTLYGTTWEGGSNAICYYYEGSGTVFSATPSGKVKVLHSFGLSNYDGSSPAAAPTELNGILYGTTHYGGSCGSGTVYRITLSGTEKVLHSFC
jgi:uncharacterized repeat protein (TIGR03803 family)